MSATTTTPAAVPAAAPAAAAPAKRTLKLCSHAINGGCRLGDACPNVHPLDRAAARAEFEAKATKTLNLCGFHPNCTHRGCTYLHVDPAPRTTEPASPPRAPPVGKTPSRAPPVGKTPSRTPPAGKTPPGGSSRPGAKASAPARSGGAKPRPGEPKSPAGGRGGPKERARDAPAQAEAARGDPEPLRLLHQIRGKINALERVRLAYGTLAKEVGSEEHQERAELALQMQEVILTQLMELASGIDGCLANLGAAPGLTENAPLAEEPSDGDSAD